MNVLLIASNLPIIATFYRPNDHIPLTQGSSFRVQKITRWPLSYKSKAKKVWLFKLFDKLHRGGDRNDFSLPCMNLVEDPIALGSISPKPASSRKRGVPKTTRDGSPKREPSPSCRVLNVTTAFAISRRPSLHYFNILPFEDSIKLLNC